VHCTAAVKRFAAVVCLALAGCGDDSGTGPNARDVRVAYQQQLPAGCPDLQNPCYPMCAHHNAPAGLQAVVPLWDSPTLRLTEAGAGRYEGTLTAVPTDTTLRLYGRDIATCCVDACAYPPVVRDIYLNGTKLTRTVTNGLPAGISVALEFTLGRDGTVRN